METSVYDNVAITTYKIPTEPGPYEQHGPGNSEEAQYDANAIHKEGRRIYDLEQNVDAALKR